MSHQQDTPTFSDPIVIPANTKPQLEFVPCYVAEVEPRACGPFVNALGEAVPLENLQHARRVRRLPSKEGLLDVLICPVQSIFKSDGSGETEDGELNWRNTSAKGTDITSEDIRFSNLPAAARSIAEQMQVKRILVANIPRNPPHTKEDQKEWSRYWPVGLRAPDKHLKRDNSNLTEDEVAVMKHYMKMAWKMARNNEAMGRVFNACVIVSPVTDAVMAQSMDGTHSHPLHHAVMVAVDNVAAWQRQNYFHGSAGARPVSIESNKGIREENGSPSFKKQRDNYGAKAPQIENGTCSRGDIHHHADSAETEDRVEHIPLPKNRSQNALQSDSTKESIAREKSQDESVSNRVLLEDEGSACERRFEEPAAKRCRQSKKYVSQTLSDIPYLCTGYDCYVLHEPCWMCAMALVHSRLRRVVFSIPDSKHGGLGGSGHRLHAQRSLNHHYSVFHLPILDEKEKETLIP